MKKLNIQIEEEQEEDENNFELDDLTKKKNINNIKNNNININTLNDFNSINKDNNDNNNNNNNNNIFINNNINIEDIKSYFSSPFSANINNNDYSEDTSYNSWVSQDINLQKLCSIYELNSINIDDILKKHDFNCELKLIKWITEDNDHKKKFFKISNSSNLNRHNDILPYKYNIVNINNDNNINNISIDDYINASYINGPFISKTDKNMFIATQGPLKNTIYNFWEMIYNKKINLIIMLTKSNEDGKNKSEIYWPENNNDLIINKNNNQINISLIENSVIIQDSLIKRKLKFNNNKNNNLIVTQYQFISWPDHHVPIEDENTYKIIEILMNNIYDNFFENNFNIPILIHCSAGVGRTGTFIALCNIIRCLKKLKEIGEKPILNVFNVVRKLREERYSMVTDKQQYKFIYKYCIDFVKDNFKLI